MEDVSRLRPTALIVDDDPAICKIYATLADAAGFRSDIAHSGREAITAMHDSMPVIVLLDMQMPGSDGLDVMRAMAEAGCKARLAIITGADPRTLEITAEIARHLGLDVVASLPKPVRADEIRTILEQARIDLSPFDAVRLKQCLDEDRVQLFYQPKIALTTRQIIGAEALLRCTDAAGRLVSPETVLTVAEDSRMIDTLSHAIFARAIAQQRAWRKQDLNLNVAVNLSPSGAVSRNLPDRLHGLCVEHEVQPSSITIELTETTVMHDNLLAMEAMVRLRLRGFELSIDDFGTGYSSLIRLQSLPFTEVKIDKSFVSLKRRSRENEKIVRAIAQLALSLDLKCVIEGIEDEDCLNFAAAVGCTAAQGYFISRALPPDQFPLFLKEWHLRQDWLRGRAVERAAGSEEPGAAKAG